MQNDYDKQYSKSCDFFGSAPDPLLVNHHHQIDCSFRVLDIGVGQGRHALYLARQGFEVDAIDTSSVAITTVQDLAAAERLPIRTFQRSFDTFFPDVEYYSAVLLFGLIQILPWDQIDFLTELVNLWTRKDSLVFVTAWTTEDSSFPSCQVDWMQIGKNSYKNPQDEIRTFLEKREILNLFREYKAIHYWEGPGPVHTHGEGEPEQHWGVEVVFKRTQ